MPLLNKRWVIAGLIVLLVIGLSYYFFFREQILFQTTSDFSFRGITASKQVLISDARHEESISIPSSSVIVFSSIPKSLALDSNQFKVITSNNFTVVEEDPLISITPGNQARIDFKLVFEKQAFNKNVCSVNVFLPLSFVNALDDIQKEFLKERLIALSELDLNCFNASQIEKELATEFENAFSQGIELKAKPVIENTAFFQEAKMPSVNEVFSSIVDALESKKTEFLDVSKKADEGLIESFSVSLENISLPVEQVIEEKKQDYRQYLKQQASPFLNEEKTAFKELNVFLSKDFPVAIKKIPLVNVSLLEGKSILPEMSIESPFKNVNYYFTLNHVSEEPFELVLFIDAQDYFSDFVLREFRKALKHVVFELGLLDLSKGLNSTALDFDALFIEALKEDNKVKVTRLALKPENMRDKGPEASKYAVEEECLSLNVLELEKNDLGEFELSNGIELTKEKPCIQLFEGEKTLYTLTALDDFSGLKVSKYFAKKESPEEEGVLTQIPVIGADGVNSAVNQKKQGLKNSKQSYLNTLLSGYFFKSLKQESFALEPIKQNAEIILNYTLPGGGIQEIPLVLWADSCEQRIEVLENALSKQQKDFIVAECYLDEARKAKQSFKEIDSESQSDLNTYVTIQKFNGLKGIAEITESNDLKKLKNEAQLYETLSTYESITARECNELMSLKPETLSLAQQIALTKKYPVLPRNFIQPILGKPGPDYPKTVLQNYVSRKCFALDSFIASQAFIEAAHEKLKQAALSKESIEQSKQATYLLNEVFEEKTDSFFEELERFNKASDALTLNIYLKETIFNEADSRLAMDPLGVLGLVSRDFPEYVSKIGLLDPGASFKIREDLKASRDSAQFAYSSNLSSIEGHEKGIPAVLKWFAEEFKGLKQANEGISVDAGYLETINSEKSNKLTLDFNLQKEFFDKKVQQEFLDQEFRLNELTVTLNPNYSDEEKQDLLNAAKTLKQQHLEFFAMQNALQKIADESTKIDRLLLEVEEKQDYELSGWRMLYDPYYVGEWVSGMQGQKVEQVRGRLGKLVPLSGSMNALESLASDEFNDLNYYSLKEIEQILQKSQPVFPVLNYLIQEQEIIKEKQRLPTREEEAELLYNEALAYSGIGLFDVELMKQADLISEYPGTKASEKAIKEQPTLKAITEPSSYEKVSEFLRPWFDLRWYIGGGIAFKALQPVFRGLAVAGRFVGYNVVFKPLQFAFKPVAKYIVLPAGKKILSSELAQSFFSKVVSASGFLKLEAQALAKATSSQLFKARLIGQRIALRYPFIHSLSEGTIQIIKLPFTARQAFWTKMFRNFPKTTLLLKTQVKDLPFFKQRLAALTERSLIGFTELKPATDIELRTTFQVIPDELLFNEVAAAGEKQSFSIAGKQFNVFTKRLGRHDFIALTDASNNSINGKLLRLRPEVLPEDLAALSQHFKSLANAGSFLKAQGLIEEQALNEILLSEKMADLTLKSLEKRIIVAEAVAVKETASVQESITALSRIFAGNELVFSNQGLAVLNKRNPLAVFMFDSEARTLQGVSAELAGYCSSPTAACSFTPLAVAAKRVAKTVAPLAEVPKFLTKTVVFEGKEIARLDSIIVRYRQGKLWYRIYGETPGVGVTPYYYYPKENAIRAPSISDKTLELSAVTDPETKALFDAISDFVAENKALYLIESKQFFAAGSVPKDFIDLFGSQENFENVLKGIYENDSLVRRTADFISTRTNRKPDVSSYTSLYRAGAPGKKVAALEKIQDCETVACAIDDIIYRPFFQDIQDLGSYAESVGENIESLKEVGAQKYLGSVPHELAHVAWNTGLKYEEKALWIAWVDYGLSTRKIQDIETGIRFLAKGYEKRVWETELIAFKWEKINHLLSGLTQTSLKKSYKYVNVPISDWDVIFFQKLGLLNEEEAAYLLKLSGTGELIPVKWTDVPNNLNPNVVLGKAVGETSQTIPSATLASKEGVSFSLEKVSPSPSFSSTGLQARALTLSRHSDASIALKALQEGKKIDLKVLDLGKVNELKINEITEKALEVDLLDLKAKPSISLTAEELGNNGLALKNLKPEELGIESIQLIQKTPEKGIASISIEQGILKIQASPSTIKKGIILSREAPAFNYNTAVKGLEKELKEKALFTDFEPELKQLIDNKKAESMQIFSAFAKDEATPDLLSFRSFDSVLSHGISENALPSNSRFVSIGIDGLKELNERFGEKKANEIMQGIVLEIQNSLETKGFKASEFALGKQGSLKFAGFSADDLTKESLSMHRYGGNFGFITEAESEAKFAQALEEIAKEISEREGYRVRFGFSNSLSKLEPGLQPVEKAFALQDQANNAREIGRILDGYQGRRIAGEWVPAKELVGSKETKAIAWSEAEAGWNKLAGEKLEKPFVVSIEKEVVNFQKQFSEGVFKNLNSIEEFYAAKKVLGTKATIATSELDSMLASVRNTDESFKNAFLKTFTDSPSRGGNLIGNEAVEFIINSQKAKGKDVTLMLLDMDNFSEFDRLGLGDKAIKDSFQNIRNTTQKYDASLVGAGPRNDKAYLIVPKKLSEAEQKALHEEINNALFSLKDYEIQVSGRPERLSVKATSANEGNAIELIEKTSVVPEPEQKTLSAYNPNTMKPVSKPDYLSEETWMNEINSKGTIESTEKGLIDEWIGESLKPR